jgi:hypothetical protein
MRKLVIPRETSWFNSMDWGFNAPGVVLWWAHIGDNHWHIARELKFQHETAEMVASRWKAVMKELGLKRVAYVAADPSMWAKTGHGRGESIAETLQRHGLPMQKGDNDRKNGWQRCHELLRMAPDGTPWLTVDRTCTYGIRSLPAQVSERRDPDDVNTGGDDHWVDAWRYGAMSRFIAGRSGKAAPPPKPGTYAYLKAQGQTVSHGLLSRRSA